jgi:predicted dehydrogenase/threonine dehydrogenase-like Zn-dependent dehydrogenase
VKQVIQHLRSGRLELVDVPEPVCRSGGIVVRNTASVISAGTEKMVIDFAGKSLLGKAKDRPDLVKQVLDKVKKDGIGSTMQTVLSRLDQPIPLGYSCAGVVEQVGRGAEEFSPGDRVACAGMGYATHSDVVFVPKNLAARVPEGASLEDAAYVTIGAIALHGVRIADVRIGESVAVIGLGLLGQVSVQILKAAGCRVIGIDLDAAKVELAREMGADAAVLRTDGVEAAVSAFTRGIGVDAVVVTAATESNDPTELAGLICRDRGRVAVVGAVKMDVPRKVYYEKELDLRLSRSYGPGRYDPEYEERGNDYPIAYVRWTERRNMEEFLRLVAAGQVTPSRLTTHRFSIERSEEAYELVTGKDGQPFLGVVLCYEERAAPTPIRLVRLAERGVSPDPTGIGFIGAGNFARAVLLPRFSKADKADLIGIATATGHNARTTGTRHGFRYCTTDVSRLLCDDSIDAVVVATRHGSHAHLAADSLRAGKCVFVEKPLAIDEEGLSHVLEAQAESEAMLFVGFNRRFSPLAAQLKQAFSSAGAPLAIQYRINAGPLPVDSWIHHPQEGGGRIIGEVCHFVDLVQFLTDDVPVEVFAYPIGGSEAGKHDTVSIVMRMHGGSLASINYFATGERSFPKELIEVFGGGVIGVLDDFRRLTVVKGGRGKKRRTLSQNKGFSEEVRAFLAAVRGQAEPPIPLDSLIATTRTTFAIEESLRTGRAVKVHV